MPGSSPSPRLAPPSCFAGVSAAAGGGGGAAEAQTDGRATSWFGRLCACMWRPPTDQLVLAALARQSEALEQLPRRIAAALAEAEDHDSDSSVVSNPQYEEGARSWLPSQLLQRCGLVVVENTDVLRADLEGLPWDFRAPVLLAPKEPHPNVELGAFEVIPTGTPAYLRPPRGVAPRYVTPTKFGGADSPPAAQYLALFEITTSETWPERAKRRGDGAFKTMASRLDERLAKSLDRAKEHGIVAGDARITDLVAVVGVVAPAACAQSISAAMTKGDVPLLLKQMMDARRFVVLVRPKAART